MAKVLGCLGDFGLGKGGVGAGANTDSKLLGVLEKLELSKYLIDVPTVSASCIDERVDKNGTRVQFAKTAGGPLSLAYALRLSGIERYAGMNELQLVDLVMETLEERGIAQHFAVHDDDGDGVGCGACAKAHDVDNEIFGNFENLSAATQKLSGSALTTSIRENARAMDIGFFADDRVEPLRLAQDDGAVIEDLVGTHDGHMIIANTQPKMTIDSVALRAAGIRAFAVDAWVFPGLAAIFAQTDTEQKIIESSQLVFNLATASVLCHADIVLRQQ